MVKFFEDDLGSGYARIELSGSNWGRRNKSTHNADPLSATAAGKAGSASRRATSWRRWWKSGAARRRSRPSASRPAQRPPGTARTCRRGARGLAPGIRACGSGSGTRGSASSGAGIRALLERFVAASVEEVLSGREAVPRTIGISTMRSGSDGHLDVTRCDRAGRVIQHLHTCPMIKAIHVGYRERAGQLDRVWPRFSRSPSRSDSWSYGERRSCPWSPRG